MKSLHFCTPNLLKIINGNKLIIFYTIRTGFIPSIYKKDIINLKDKTKENLIVGKAQVINIYPIMKFTIDNMFKPKNSDIIIELQRYNRQFNPEHYFFLITLKKLE